MTDPDSTPSSRAWLVLVLLWGVAFSYYLTRNMLTTMHGSIVAAIRMASTAHAAAAERINAGIGLGFAGAFLGIALFYGFLWVLTGSETAGQRWTGLRLINFDGTPIDRRERIFDRFWRGRDVDTKGVGLGLAIVKTIMEAHRGTVEVRNHSGQGAIFTLTFAQSSTP